MTFSNINRSDRLKSSKSTQFDLVVIGGGITGAGIFLDATLRGMKCLLIEKEDFASGTSSKSTKLIHGGLRYLKQLEIGLVRETGLERAVAHNNICHLVHPEKMLLPIVKNGTFSYLTARVAISVYDMLADVKSDDRCKGLTKKQVRELEPLLDEKLIQSGIIYSEYRTDDSRLTIELIKAAVRNGGEAFNYMKAESFEYDKNGQIIEVKCVDQNDSSIHNFSASFFINSTGPWVDQVRQADDQQTVKNLHLSKGVHIVVSDDRFSLSQAVYFDAFDGRMLFAIPRNECVYIGTTDTTFTKDIDDPDCTEEDIDYILTAANGMFKAEPPLSRSDVLSHWSGLRPLIKGSGESTTELSRKDEIFESNSGLISIAGGKLTGYRKMAKKIVDLINKKTEKDYPESSTKDFKIHQLPFDSYDEYLKYTKDLVTDYGPEGLNIETSIYLVSNYGKDSAAILESAFKSNSTSIEESIILAELDHCIRHESIYHPIDFFERRTGRGYFNLKSCTAFTDVVVEELSSKLGLTEEISILKLEVENWIRDQALVGQKSSQKVASSI